MGNNVHSQIMGIITRIQNYSGLEGLATVKHKISRICEQYACPCPASITLFLEAYTYDRTDHIELAISGYNQCLSTLNGEDIQLRVYTNTLLASLHIDKEDYTIAYTLYEEVLKNIHLVDDNVRSLIYCNISDMYLCLEKFEQAIEYSHQGVQASKNANHPLNQAICLLNLGFCHGHLGNFDTAIGYIQEAKHIAKEKQHQRILAISYTCLAQTMAKQSGAPEQTVIEYFEQAEHTFKQTFDTHNRLENRVFFAQYLERINKDHYALSLCHELKEELATVNNYSFYSVYIHTLEKLYNKKQHWDILIDTQQEHIHEAEKMLNQLKQQQNDKLVKNVDTIEDNQHQYVLTKMQEHMGAITEIGQFIATTPDLDSSLTDILTKINTILPTFEFGIALYDKETADLNYRYFVDTNGLVPNLVINCNQYKTVGTYVIKNRTTVHLNTVNDDALAPFVDHEQRKEKDLVVRKNSPLVNSIILTPITLKDEILGLLSVQHHAANQYHQHHRNLIEHLASFIAVSLENQKQRHRLEDANQTLDLLSKTDPLTGLYNRYQLDKITPTLVNHAIAEKKHMAVLMLDLDDYKNYNDAHGHLKGDEALVMVSQLMQQVFFDECDYLFRYGGDEFLIICVGQETNNIEKKIQRLQSALHDVCLCSPKSRYSDRLSLSIGGVNTLFFNNSELICFNQLSHKADEELYKVKAAGRNHYSLIES